MVGDEFLVVEIGFGGVHTWGVKSMSRGESKIKSKSGSMNEK